MKYTIRTPGPNNYGDEFLHAVVRVPSNHKYRSVCGKPVRAWRKVKDGTVTCKTCLKRFETLKETA